MKRITRPKHITRAVLSLLCFACGAAIAGEPHVPMPTEPTLFYACMSSGGRFEYDSAAFARKNPGPVYKDHYDLSVKMSAAFDAYLTQKYGFHGLVQCGQYKTLAEAQKWLQWRESESRAPGKNYQYFATDWTFDAALTEPAPAATTTTHDATAQAAQPAASAASVPTAFFVCVAVVPGVAYESAVFEARNDAGSARRMHFAFATHLSQKHNIGAMPACRSRPTRAEAQAYLQEYSAGVSGEVTQHVATGWVYDPTPNQSAQPVTHSSPVVSAAPASQPAAPKPAAPKPAAPQAVAAAAAIQPAPPAPAPAKKTMFVVCRAIEDPRARYFNPPVDGGDGGYETWQPSYQSFLQNKYHYDRSVGCNKSPTLAEAQKYFNTIVDQANLYKEINGIPSPVIVTNWKFK